MNLIEALREAKGKPVRRELWDAMNPDPNKRINGVSFSGAKLTWYGDNVTYLSKENFLADDWYIVAPKSKIEEAIERAEAIILSLKVKE